MLPVATLAQTPVPVPVKVQSQVQGQEQPQPGFTVSLERLQQELAQRFPLRFPVQGLLDLDVRTPQIRLLPQQNRLGAEMSVEAAGPALRRSHTGALVLDFALRYEPSDRSIRAYQIAFRNLRFPDLAPQASDLLNAYGPVMAQELLQEVVLYRVRDQDLALAENLGLQPGSITVTDKGLRIGLVPKPL
ncbi:MAG: DUF1439 domain-containing protein [Burkholderiaceae bacterium]